MLKLLKLADKLMASIFTKIINGEIPACKIAEDEYCIAFLDINPLSIGHTLVVPKLEVDNIFDLPADNYKLLFSFAQKIAKAIEKSIVCKKVGIAVIGLEVPHAHIHLIPINDIYDIDFKKTKLKFTTDELNEIAGRIASNIVV